MLDKPDDFHYRAAGGALLGIYRVLVNWQINPCN